MDIGKRPSRLRRHLPMAMKNSDTPSSRPLGNDDTNDTHEEENGTVSQSSYREYPSGGGQSLRRRRILRRRARSMLGDDDVTPPDARQFFSKSIHQQQQQQWRSTVFQWLFWISCGGWAVFLVFRVLTSLWLGEYQQLSLVHFVARSLIQ